jgi:drug/metabolite transporter (DMT)-like permease
LITFIFLSFKSKKFRKQVGEISFFDFKKLYKNYFLFSFVFLLNNLFGFFGNQLIVNTPMFLTLRKLVLVMIYFSDIFIGKKKLSCFITSCVFMVTFGSVLAGIEDFSSDYKGYIVVIIYNSLTVLYNKMTETFKKKTGISNLKLLVYNSFLLVPTLFCLIFVFKEYQAVNLYMRGQKVFEGSYFGLFVYLFFSFAFCIALMLSFFISNEKNSSLFTAMLSNSKDIAITALSYFWLSGTKFTFCIIGGLLISTVGALLISTKSMIDNMKKKDEKEKIEKKEYAPIGIIDEDKNKE